MLLRYGHFNRYWFQFTIGILAVILFAVYAVTFMFTVPFTLIKYSILTDLVSNVDDYTFCSAV